MLLSFEIGSIIFVCLFLEIAREFCRMFFERVEGSIGLFSIVDKMLVVVDAGKFVRPDKRFRVVCIFDRFMIENKKKQWTIELLCLIMKDTRTLCLIQ